MRFWMLSVQSLGGDNLKAKEYLNQARYLEQRIESNIEQWEQMNALATKVTTVISDMPKSPGGSTSRLEDTIVKILEFEEEIRTRVDTLVSLKSQIASTIEAVPQEQCRLILTKRYLSHKTWEDIAHDLDYDLRWVHRLHKRALQEVQQILDAAA